MESTLTSKGQITLPKALRTQLHLQAGDKVFFEQQDDGSYALRPRTLDVTVLKGCLNYSGPTLSLEDMDAAIARNAGCNR
ncbi:MAG: AbrB/MazE/SpoVT family DNA-binding domain-containing protein [Candidatus Hydrogenedentes bacterium]|nr:AbrB/MazE/SpoVT family DNA-binding domain-containing protein [Candidatus Hydrogenedentota bacterium]